MTNSLESNHIAMEMAWILRGQKITELETTQAALVEALEAIVERSFKTVGTAYVMSGGCMQQARVALKLAKGE